MKKILTLITLTLALSMFTGCSYLKRNEARKAAQELNDIRVTFKTTQGDVHFFMYPEATPLTVANFVNLAKRGYYNGNKVHRAVEGFIVQAGDPTETGTGGPGYTIRDEIVDWLDFYQPGMLAMANAGAGTGGSQYFFTMYPADWLNKKHTVFGEVVSDEDFDVIRKLEIGDVIKEVEISGPADFLLALHRDQVEQWNYILNEAYPELEEYPLKEASEFDGQVEIYREELERLYTPKEEVKEEDKEWPVPRFIRAVEKAVTKEKTDAEKLEPTLREEEMMEATGVISVEITSDTIEMSDGERTEVIDREDNEERADAVAEKKEISSNEEVTNEEAEKIEEATKEDK